jgi:Helix-turn-helix domain
MQPIGELLKDYQNIVLSKEFDPVSAGGFTQVPNYLLRSPQLSNNAKVVYAKLLSYAWNNDRCFPGQDRMAADIGTSQPTIARAIQDLQVRGWLEVKRRGQGKTNIYVLKYVVDKSM